jgi:hypothetical protein
MGAQLEIASRENIRTAPKRKTGAGKEEGLATLTRVSPRIFW